MKIPQWIENKKRRGLDFQMGSHPDAGDVAEEESWPKTPLILGMVLGIDPG